jgi:glycosyltransferase involved in cell wall biosynthesis
LKASDPLPLSQLVEGEDYKTTTGGVTRMLLPLLTRWLGEGRIGDAEWVALGADEDPPTVVHEGVKLSFVGMPAALRAGYANVKERIWALLNSDPSTVRPHGTAGIAESDWQAFDTYQSLSAEALMAAGARMGGLDLLYVHDFQQVGVAGAWRGPRTPKVFHLHTPFPSGLPSAWVEYLLADLSRYDAVVVSTPRYAANLRAVGLRTPVHVIPPFIDPSAYDAPSPGASRAFRERYDIGPDDRIILNVGRMDPIKGQDRLLRALPAILAKEPRARLVLVGNGSFSSSKNGGLGLSKGHQWRASLEALATSLGVSGRVTFTGHLDEDLLPAAYAATEVFCLPSTREGFGLAAIEAWRYQKPVVVSDRTGVAEHVVDGVNGFAIDCGDPDLLADALLRAMRSPDRDAMGRQGRETSEVATITAGRAALERVFAQVLEEAPRAVA